MVFKFNQKKLILSTTICVTILVLLFFINKTQPYLRTDIFRSFAKGNWYIISEGDTVYSMGYHGITKYHVSNNNLLKVFAQNDKFCNNRIFGRGGTLYNDYIFVTARSFLPGSYSKDSINGQLIVLNKYDLTITNSINYKLKLINSKIINNQLIISAIGGFFIYDLSNPIKPKLLFSHKSLKYKEYQGFDFFETKGKTFIAFTLFGEGLEIWDITKISESKHIISLPNDKFVKNGYFYNRNQSMDIIANYPYLYSTLGPTNESFNTIYEQRGIYIYNIADFDNIIKKQILIPAKDWYNKRTGDKQPTYIAAYKEFLYTNFAEKGVAKFNISNKSNPVYDGTLDITDNELLIQPIHISANGKIFTGHYYWSQLYCKQLEKNGNLK